MKLKVKKLYESKILTGVLLIVLVKPHFFNEIGWLDRLYDNTSVVIAVFLIIASIVSIPIPKSRIWIIMFYGAMFFTTVCSGGSIYEYMRSNFASLALCLMFDIWLTKSPETLIDGFSILGLLVYANFITILLFPKGMYRTDLYSANWLLGYKNYQIRTILPIICMALIRSYWKWGKIAFRAWILLACSASTLVLVDSATALVGYTLFLVLLMLYHSKEKTIPPIINMTNGIIASAVILIGIVFFNIQTFMSFLIENILGKNLTFTGRLSVWKMSILYFLKKPILGYGYLSGDEYEQMYNSSLWAAHPHNYILYILLTGGLLLGIITIIGYWMASQNIKKNIESIYGKIILFTLCSFLIMGITEAITSTVLLYPMLVLGMNIDKVAALGYSERRKVTLKIGKRIVRT